MRTGFALLALAVAGAAAAQEAPLEHVRQPPLRGFTQIVGEQGAASGLEQWVLRGQTALNWTRMVTLQRFPGLALRTTPVQYLATLGQSARAVCPGARIGAVSETASPGYPTAQVRVDCALNPATAAPETFFVRAMAGSTDLYVLQVSLRRVRHDDITFAERHTAGVMLCGAASRERDCGE
jgi:hypothetical protein